MKKTFRSPHRPRPSRRLGLAAAAALGLAVVLGAPALAQEASPERFLQARDRILGDPSYQTELPVDGGTVTAGGSRNRALADDDGWDRGGRAAVPEPPPTRSRHGWSLPATPEVALVVLGVVLVLLVLWLMKEGRSSLEWLRVGSETPRAEPTPSRRGAAPRSCEDAEALAARGAYAEAVHCLLLAALAALGRGGRAAFIPGHTSREILANLASGHPARGALGELVSAVERSLFGGRTVSAADWASCRSAYGVVAAATGDSR